MKFTLSQSLVDRFAEVGSQRKLSNPLIIAKFIQLNSRMMRYPVEFDPQTGKFYGYVYHRGDYSSNIERFPHTFSLADFAYYESIGLPVEQVCDFKEQMYSEWENNRRQESNEQRRP